MGDPFMEAGAALPEGYVIIKNRPVYELMALVSKLGFSKRPLGSCYPSKSQHLSGKAQQIILDSILREIDNLFSKPPKNS